MTYIFGRHILSGGILFWAIFGTKDPKRAIYTFPRRILETPKISLIKKYPVSDLIHGKKFPPPKNDVMTLGDVYGQLWFSS